ncbi:MAG TPA: RsmD family RNA methyltransferase, partial [Opitutaceae bacterium]|nr:RsmD family RNA methyltransferase [Opitutaceae bacterium]
MRISGGLARGISLVVPKGDAVRPATDGMRQAVFSSLVARVPGA